jgi:hypothetical protein
MGKPGEHPLEHPRCSSIVSATPVRLLQSVHRVEKRKALRPGARIVSCGTTRLVSNRTDLLYNQS